MTDFETMYRQVKERDPEAPKYMPAPWQGMEAVKQIGEHEELYFFEITKLYIDDEPVPDGTYYCDKASVEFDRMIEEAKLRRKLLKQKEKD